MFFMKDLTGKRFSRLTVLKDSGERTQCKRIIWLCQCDCGNTSKVRTDNLKSGNTKSCGCLQREWMSCVGKKYGPKYGKLYGGPGFKHGDGKGVRIYRIWNHIINRCYNSKAHNYKYYGKRGIQVCEKWRKSYLAFKEWGMKSGYQENLVIDRIDNDGNYEPNNCHWLTIVENAKKSQVERKSKARLFEGVI